MKKIFCSILAIMMVVPCIFAADDNYPKYSTPIAQYLLAYKDESIFMSMRISEEVLPFDIDSPVVKSVESNGGALDVVSGLRIGYYSLVSNFSDFTVKVTHDKLKWYKGNNTPLSTQISEIDYRLYMFTEDNKFESCLSGEQGIVLNEDCFENTIKKKSIVSAANNGVYLSLAISDTGNVAPGEYESYITIHVEK